MNMKDASEARRQWHVLVADDDPASRKMLVRTLESWGYRVTAVSDGISALGLLESEEAPDLALLDWMMPGLDGPGVCRRLRASQAEHYTFIVLLTSRDDRDDIVEGLEAGADDYVTKPFDKVELEARLRVGVRIVDLHRELSSAYAHMAELAMYDPLTRLPNRRAIMEVLASEIDRADRTGSSLGVMVVDLDHFKRVNDSYGHQA